MHRVLVVDDMPEICVQFERIVRRLELPIELVTESNSERALARVQTEPFDLVVSDFSLTGLDGVAVLTAARVRNPTGRRILMTGHHAIPASAARMEAASVDAYLQKPFLLDDVTRLIRDLANADAAVATAQTAARAADRRGGDDRMPTDEAV